MLETVPLLLNCTPKTRQFPAPVTLGKSTVSTLIEYLSIPLATCCTKVGTPGIGVPVGVGVAVAIGVAVGVTVGVGAGEGVGLSLGCTGTANIQKEASTNEMRRDPYRKTEPRAEHLLREILVSNLTR
ncbi:MAG: hypothetical protein DME50_16495 [Verrucomicrobia bacterium]|nr:MAG: hypothetical protein DME50_16495 [Verrucomicrobiota bacterium]